MKESGTPWIGKIPDNWNMKRLKFLSNISTGDKDTVMRKDDGLYPFFVRSPKVERIDTYTYEGEAILMAGDGVGAGKVFHYFNGKFDFHQRVYNIHNFRDINAKYLLYQMTSLFDKILESQNAKSTVDSVRLPMLLDYNVICPTADEQQKISTFLDEKCSEIDSLISLQDDMIVKLQEYKQSVIAEAVTRGLDPSVPMKHSGIEWIGMIPENWSIDKCFRIFTKMGSGTTPKTSSENIGIGNINWIQSGDINGFIMTSCKNKISQDIVDKYSALKVYKSPFLIIAMYGASIGNISKSAIDGSVNQACCVFSESTSDMDFMFYSLKSAKDYLIYKSVGGGQPNISQETLKQLWLTKPSLDEQHEIADFLDRKCSEIDSLIEIKKNKIEVLKEYKKSLIYECVTGKREVA